MLVTPPQSCTTSFDLEPCSYVVRKSDSSAHEIFSLKRHSSFGLGLRERARPRTQQTGFDLRPLDTETRDRMAFDYKAIEAEVGNRDYFPNTNSVAYFDPQSQTIHVNRISKAVFQDALAKGDLPDLRQHLCTLLHEITHWADLVGTTFGRDYLRTVYDALRLLPEINSPGQEEQFYRFIDLHDRTRRLMLSRYYRTVNPSARPHDLKQRWGIQLSAGCEFDTRGRQDLGRPIMFVRFLDNPSGDLVARQPIVVGALLEVNAMWSEMRAAMEIVGAMSEPERTIEQALYDEEIRGYIYDPNLTLYTAPAHLLAHFAQITEIGDAYWLASAVAHIALNLSPDDFDKLVLPQSMQPWAALFDGFKLSQDRGFAFAIICAAASPWSEEQTVSEWLDRALNKAGLGASATILLTALTSARSASVGDDKTLLGSAERYLLSLGERILEIRSAGDTALTPNRVLREKLILPPVFDRNGDLITIAGGIFDIEQFSPAQMHGIAAQLHTWTQNFIGACR